MTDDEKNLLYIIRYAGSDAGQHAQEELLTELQALRKLAECARELVEYVDEYKLENEFTPTHWRLYAALRGAVSSGAPSLPIGGAS